MKKNILNWNDLQVGKTYNRVYTGSHTAYGACNGKTTFRVVEKTKDKLVTETLFDQFGSATDPEIRSNETTYSVPQNVIGTEYMVTECTDPKEYFIHSQAMYLSEAVKADLVNAEDLKAIFKDKSGDFARRNPIVSSDWGKAFYFSLSAKTSKEFPYLQRIFCVYKKMAELKADVVSVYPAAWFMD